MAEIPRGKCYNCIIRSNCFLIERLRSTQNIIDTEVLDILDIYKSHYDPRIRIEITVLKCKQYKKEQLEEFNDNNRN